MRAALRAGSLLAIDRSIPIACALLALAGCRLNNPTRWNVDTTYVVEDISEDGKAALRRALDIPKERARYGFQMVHQGREGEPFVFKLTQVTDMRTLEQVQEKIQSVSELSRYPVVLQSCQMTFASVYGQASSEIQIHGTATPGATVCLDLGTRTMEVQVGSDGLWTAAISRNGKLSVRRGWVYGSIKKGAARHFIKMNVLDTKASTRIRFEDLPADSLLRK